MRVLARQPGTGHMPSMCRPVLTQNSYCTLPPRYEDQQPELLAFNATPGEELLLQGAVMESSYRGNVARIYKGDGSLQAHTQCKVCVVQALEEFRPVDALLLQNAATAVANSHFDSGECLRWEQNSEGKWSAIDAKSEGIHLGKVRFLLANPVRGLWAVELCLESIRGLHSIGSESRDFKPTSSVLEQVEGAAENMVRLRERQLSRRGPGRGAPSRPPAADVHHHCCCCYCYRRVGAIPIPASQFLEVGSSNGGESVLPAFGSVVFTLGSSRENAGINAHISVLFTKVPEGNEDGKQPVSAEILPEGNREESPVLQPPIEKGNSGKELQQAPPRPPEQEPPATAKDPMALWEGIPEGQGWSYIIEEEPED